MRLDEAFLEEICTRPDDDAPRLIYADWLDEHDQSARAEFIRAQIEMTRLSSGSRRFAVLRRRALAFLAEHREGWLRDLPSWARAGSEFHRGFVRHVFCTALHFIKQGEQLLRAAPVQSLRLRRLDGRITALAESPHLARINALDIRCNYIDSREWEALAASPHLTRLNTLRLRFWENEDSLLVLATSPWLAGLTMLNLSGSFHGLAGLRWLLESPHCPQPTKLCLAFNRLDDEEVQRLASSACLDRIITLDLSWNRIGSQGIQMLADSPHLTCLTSLKLARNNITDAGARALAESSRLDNLRRLDLRNNSIDVAGAALRQRFGRRVKL